jgi:hypothetical protein
MTLSGNWLHYLKLVCPCLFFSILQPLMLRVSHQLFHGLIAVIAIDSDNFVEFIIPGLFNLVIVYYVNFMTKSVALQPSWHS